MLSIFSKQKIYIVIFYIVLVFVFKVSVLDKPIWWSERAYVEGAIKVYQNNLNPFVEFHSYKPPLLFVLTALGYKIFGTSTVVPRFIIALFAVATLYFTFLLGKKIYSKEAGFFASLLLFFSATFFTQSESFVAALPVAALALATIYFYFTNKKWGYFISAGLLVLTKELAILILVAIVLYEILNSVYSFLKLPKKASFPNSLKGLISKIAFLLSPTLFFFMWMIGNKILLGWFLWPLNAEIIKNTAFNAWEIKWILYRLFWDDFRFLITAAVIICFLKNTVRKQFIKKEVMLFYILAVITIIAFWMGCGVHPAGIDDIPPLPRYYLYLQPLFFILGAQSILALFRKKFLYSMIFAIVIFLSVQYWTPSIIEINGENDLNHRYIAMSLKQAAEFLQEKYPAALILVEEDYMTLSAFTSPEMGYVKQPFETVMFNKQIELIKEIKRSRAKKRVLGVSCEWVYKTKNSNERPKSLAGYAQELIQKGKADIIATFENGPERVTIYSL